MFEEKIKEQPPKPPCGSAPKGGQNILLPTIDQFGLVGDIIFISSFN
jgi:hypothetical protein